MQSLNPEVLLNQKRSFGGVLKENCSETFRKKDGKTYNGVLF